MSAMPPGETMRIQKSVWPGVQSELTARKSMVPARCDDFTKAASGIESSRLKGLNKDSELLIPPKWIIENGKGVYAAGQWKVLSPIGTPICVNPNTSTKTNSHRIVVSAVPGQLEGDFMDPSPCVSAEFESISQPELLDRNATPRAPTSKSSTRTHTRTQTPIIAVPSIQHIRAQSTASSASIKTDDNPTPRPPPAGSSWANIASSSDPDTKLINLQPTSRIETAAPRLRPSNGDNVVCVKNTAPTCNPEDPPGRVVFIMDIPANLTLHEVSDAIIEGPLARIQFGFQDGKRFVGIVFQYAWHAEAFYSVIDEEVRLSKPSRFRFTTSLIELSDYARDEFIDAVDEGKSRRLTIVKAKFFFMLTKEQLQAYCEKLVGPEAVQLVWCYNGGNATVVFADVLSAAKVKEDFDRKAEEGRGMWEGVVTSFSKDPCYVPLGELSTTLAE